MATGELFTGAKHDRDLVEMARKIAGRPRLAHQIEADSHWEPRMPLPSPRREYDRSPCSAQDTTRLVPNYHTREDTPEHVRPEALSVTLQMVLEMIQRIDNA